MTSHSACLLVACLGPWLAGCSQTFDLAAPRVPLPAPVVDEQATGVPSAQGVAPGAGLPMPGTTVHSPVFQTDIDATTFYVVVIVGACVVYASVTALSRASDAISHQ